MAKVLYCKDLGFECGFVARGEGEDQLLDQVAQHASGTHGIDEVSPELVERVRAAIREE